MRPACLKVRVSANGAGYESQGQVRSEAEHVAPGSRQPPECRALKGRNKVGVQFESQSVC